MKKVILCSLIFLATINFVKAGTPVITDKTAETQIVIKGRVIDKKTGEPLVGAVVNIENSDNKVYTDLDGNFEVKNMKEGNYNLIVSYISYNSSLIEQTVLKSNVNPALEIELVEESK